MHGSLPSEHSQCPNISPSIQALLDLPADWCFCFLISRIHVLNGAGDTPGPSAGTDHQVSAILACVPLETSDMDISTASTNRLEQVDPTPAITMGIQPSPIITVTPPAPELEFKSPVHRTAKRPETGLDWTGRNRTAVASCLLLRMMKKTGCNRLQPHYVSNTYMV